MNRIQVSQEILKRAGLYDGKIDGDFGRKSMEAARKYFDFPNDWRNDRVSVGVLQVYATRNNIPTGIIDGFWGNNTERAYTQIVKILKITPTNESVKVNQNVVVKPSFNKWPSQNYNELVRFYGEVGKNQTSLKLPYPMKLAWDSGSIVQRFTCHQKVKDVFEEVFVETLDHYGLDGVKELRLDVFGGCLNVRRMRGGNAWSMHSWGIAYDLDPDRNRLTWGRDKAVFAKAEYEPYWKIVESKGLISLGRLRNYDWMHVQAATI
jgi:hypothetical protein